MFLSESIFLNGCSQMCMATYTTFFILSLEGLGASVVFLQPFFPFLCEEAHLGTLGFLPECEDMSSSSSNDTAPVFSPLLSSPGGVLCGLLAPSHRQTPPRFSGPHAASNGHCSPLKHKLLHIHPLRLRKLWNSAWPAKTMAPGITVTLDVQTVPL